MKASNHERLNAGKYEARGVSSHKGEVHRAVKALPRGLFPNAFCTILPDTFSPKSDDVLILHSDGAGTKSIVAYLIWRETGETSAFKALSHDAAVMNADDMLCAGVTGPIILSNTISRNKALVSGEVIAALMEGFNEFAQSMEEYGLSISIAGGETADVGDLVRTLVVDATCFSRLKRPEVIDASGIRPGDVIVGLSSSGRACYEKEENSGIGSNGFTSARHDLLSAAYAEKYPEVYCPQTGSKYRYTGPYRIEDPLPGSGLTVGKALCSPSRTYVPVLKEVLGEARELIHGIVHNTGGGQTKCLNFGKGLRYVKENLFQPPPVFRTIKEQSSTGWKEMYEVFNMGHRMEVYTNGEGAALVSEKAAEFSVDAKVIGHVEKAAGGMELVLPSPGGTITWRK